METKIQNQVETIKPEFDDSVITPIEIEKDVVEQDFEITGEYLLNRKINDIPFLVQGVLQRSGIVCLAGPSDVGKSMLLRMLGIAVVTRQPQFLGFPLTARFFSTIFVSTEDQENETSFLLSKQSKGFNPENFKGLRFLFDTEDMLGKLDKMLTNSKADVVIIDCFSDAYGGDLKDTQKIRTYLHPFQDLAKKHDTLVMFLHHTGKRTENFEPSKNNLLAGQGFEAKMRTVMELRGDASNPNYRHLCIVKGNYLPAHMKRDSFILEFDDQNFLFRNTGDRMPFEMLSKQPNEDSSKGKYELARAFKDQGFTYDQIATKLGYAGKGSISKLFDKAEKNGWGGQGFLKVSHGNPTETKD